ncbi:MAG: hypothetical protein HC769_26825 [Cyanobacteria bacterium CRU_2_1]|nr:hypothetical protein [Cyanobacteria bacterium CRU_2_1]
MVQGGSGGIVQPAPNDLTVEGDVVVRNGSRTRIRLDRETGSIFAHNNEGQIVFQWEMPGNNLRFGGGSDSNADADADLVMFKGNVANLRDLDQATFHVNTRLGTMRIGGNDTAGSMVCLDANNNQTVFLDGAAADLIIGAPGASGNIILRGADAPLQNRIQLDAENANIRIGGNKRGGDCVIFPPDATDRSNLSQATIHLDGEVGGLRLGGNNTNGAILLRSDNSEERIRLNAENAFIRVGGNNRGGDVVVYPTGATNLDDLSQSSIHLNGDAGDIILRNADCAEEFDVAEEIEPGTVMVLDAEGKLRQSVDPYDLI